MEMGFAGRRGMEHFFLVGIWLREDGEGEKEIFGFLMACAQLIYLDLDRFRTKPPSPPKPPKRQMTSSAIHSSVRYSIWHAHG